MHSHTSRIRLTAILLLAVLLVGCTRPIKAPESTADETSDTPPLPITDTSDPIPPVTDPPATESAPPETEPPAETEPPRITVSELSVPFGTVSFGIGQTITPRVTVLPADAADPTVRWSSSDPTVASVDEDGRITALAAGECTVTAASADHPEITAAVAVQVVGGDACTYIDGLLIVNKTYPLPKSYAPGMDAEAFSQLCLLFNAAKAEGHTLRVKSSYRSYQDQNYIYKGYAARDGQEAADRYSARPGHSEHQSGLAFDLNELTAAFGESPEGIWLAENCHRYGFILRYPQGKESVTGYMYEPWHMRYVGTEAAASIRESGLTLEEYFGITSVYP